MLFAHLRTHLIFSANTDVGKTIFATALVRASAAALAVHYLKPVSTGPAHEADYSHVQRFAANHHRGGLVSTACLYQLDDPVSPHLAVKMAQERTASALVSQVDRLAFTLHSALFASLSNNATTERVTGSALSSLFIETAGGVHSPTLSGLTQADAYRPFRIPTILIADSRLGGISTTLSSYESLLVRGYTIDAVLLFKDDYYRNHEYLMEYFGSRSGGSQAYGMLVHAIEPPPARQEILSEDKQNLEAYYASLCDPVTSASFSSTPMSPVVRHLELRHHRRLEELTSMPSRTLESIWWPFVQHKPVQPSDITVIDSAHGDHFSSFGPASPSPSVSQPMPPVLTQQFDGSASWWTQCLGHGNPEIMLAAASAAGRYGHVIFPLATHEPALELSERLLGRQALLPNQNAHHTPGPGAGWADKVFFSDDGSTGMEVALKMAIRASALRYPFTTPRQTSSSAGAANPLKKDREIIGISGSYHGDTIGAMDACEGGVYNSAVEWHRERGYWFDPPRVEVNDGVAVVRIPQSWRIDDDNRGLTEIGASSLAPSLQWLYNVPARLASSDPFIALYKAHITETLERLVKDEKRTFGALVLEPILMGAAGMVWVDPLFQRVLIDIPRPPASLSPPANPSPGRQWRGLPVIFDEVFVGLYRLGFMTSSSVLGTTPDISVLAKILTGGLVPMSVTLASDSIYDAFWAEQKKDALLHGHSYTAHPVGCAVACKTLEIIDDMNSGTGHDGANWRQAKAAWGLPAPAVQTSSAGGVWSLWDLNFVAEASKSPLVGSVMAMGTVLAIELKDSANDGYQAYSAQLFLQSVQKNLSSSRRSDDQAQPLLPMGLHFRPLGNVAYLMTSLNTTDETIRALEKALLLSLK
ncbi:PLP-dependent transferase [Clavulina sp. PMI_390]|nr:PLP-dependent transferase [Clavulina sp. PMI_390]